MYATTSQTWQGSPPQNLVPDDGSIWAALQGGLTPDPLLTVSEWADEHRVLDSTSSSEAGQWSTKRTPYLKEIMDALATNGSPMTWCSGTTAR